MEIAKIMKVCIASEGSRFESRSESGMKESSANETVQTKIKRYLQLEGSNKPNQGESAPESLEGKPNLLWAYSRLDHLGAEDSKTIR